jgi:hypothetical protein
MTFTAGLASMCACMMEDDDETAGTTSATNSSSATTGSGGSPMPTKAQVSGEVTRSADIAEGNDGIGTLYVAAFDVCEHTGMILGAAIIPDADVSSADAAVPYAIKNLPRSTVYLAMFLDDNGNADPAAPLPDAGDLVYGTNAGDGILDCVTTELEGGDLENFSLELNLVED